MLAVQGPEAGGHFGTFTPQHLSEHVPLTALVRQLRQVVGLPLAAAGGLATAIGIAAMLRQGLEAVMVGTVLLRTNESGASIPHRRALAESGDRQTIVTRAFTGRPARAIPNAFTDRFHALAPSGYPALHHLTSPLRKAAAAADDPERINLWAGSGYRFAREGSTTDVLERLAEEL
jgi:nitronate monooxygenase